MIRDKTRNHHVSVRDFIPEAQKRLAGIFNEEYQELYSLRLSGKERLWGIIEGGVFYIVWYDKHHEVCPSEKKNT